MIAPVETPQNVLTIPSPPHEILERTQFGRCSYEEWCALEALRRRRKGERGLVVRLTTFNRVYLARANS
jgi:hypothetical protein